MTKKEPVFDCYPSRLLGALSGMEADEGYLYVVMLLRIYEAGGPIPEDERSLARRCGYTPARARKALDALVLKTKITRRDDGTYSNPQAENQIAEQNENDSERSQKAKAAAIIGVQKRQQKQQIEPADAELPLETAQMVTNDALNKIESKKESKSKTASDKRGSRIDPNWKLTAERGNYGRSKGLHRREVEQEAEKFVNYWTGRAGAGGVKLDWEATWRNWCISTAQRLGRTPPPDDDVGQNGQNPAGEFDRKTWENLSKIYEGTNNWSRQWGPEPGKTGCQMPLDLQKRFVNHGLTQH